MAPPRICIVSEIFHPEDQGGQGRQAFELARQLIRQGVPVRVVTRRNFDGSSRHEAIEGIDITRLSPTGLLKGRGWAAIPRTLYFLAGLFWHLVRHRGAYDVLFVQGVKGVLIPTFAATALCGKPYVIKIDALAELQHALTPESLARMGLSRSSPLARIWSRTRDVLLGRAAAVVAISSEIEAELRRRFGSKLTIVRVPNGVALNTAAFGRTKAELRRELALPDGDLVIYTGRLSRAKGLMTLMEAWAHIAPRQRHAHLVLVGGGDRSFDNCEVQLRNHVAEERLQLQVTFVGHVADVTPYLASSDLFIQCSESEGFGMSLIEAMAAGLPSISTPVGVATEVVAADRNGWLTPVGDSQALTAVIEQAFAARGRWSEMSTQARAAVQSKFDFETVAGRYLQLFKQLLTAELPEPDVPLTYAKTHTADVRRWDTELLEYTHDAIIVWEMEGGGILYWNRAAEQLYGYHRTEVQGHVTHELLRTQLTGGVSQLESTLARFGVWVGELRHRTRDGREVVVDARLAILAQHSGRWLVLEVNRDLTDAKLAESQRAAAERQLAEWHGRHERSA
jgi:PAS domain S-box-containing protein